MAEEHRRTDPEAHGAWEWSIEDAVLGAPTVPVVPSSLGSGGATLVSSPARAWNGNAPGTPVLVPYSFATRDSGYYAANGAALRDGFDPARSEGFDAVQRVSVREALAHWEQVSGLFFVEVADPAIQWYGGIRFGLENLPLDPFTITLGQTTAFPALSDGVAVTIQRRLYADDPMRPGSQGFLTLLHEIGHAVGLKHPFEGAARLPAIHDNTANTVMSYTDIGNRSGLGPYDVAAAQHLYGTAAARETLAVRWSHGPGGTLVSTGNDAANTITGEDVRDIVRAGGGADTIHGWGQDDDIAPGNGADTVFGDAGFDTVWAEAPRRHATLADDPSGWKLLALPNGTDRLHLVETVRFFDGQAVFHADLPAGKVLRLYEAALGRAPDPIGFGEWAQALETGATSLKAMAGDFAGSAEFAIRFGAPDDAGFVSLLYANVLGRAPDAAGLNSWLNAMAAGEGRAGVLLGFSESAECKTRTADAYAATGLWVPDPDAVDVLRSYVAVLDRSPDAGGLASWTAAREGGLDRFELVDRFVQSAEFQARFGALSNRDFVDLLYRTALDRQADPGGLAVWTQILDAGVESRAGVAFGFANSPEMTAKLTPLVEDGILLA